LIVKGAMKMAEFVNALFSAPKDTGSNLGKVKSCANFQIEL
jgi:hypothetical protein